MPTIDSENAKQIRQPMDVLITMEVPDEGISLTFSGYSTAKVADGILNRQSWPMRKLADLQGDGFPLDGTHVLYNANTSPSEPNGKLGVRGNIGEPVTITVTGSRTISGLSIFATGASSVSYNGQTSAIIGGQAIITVNAMSVELTFNPAEAGRRVEVSDIIAGTVLRVVNENLIRATVSLRSDLSIIDPTLPESELNVEVHNDADISDVVASLAEDTPITYSAGYPGDMSPTRKFYISGQVTWADNVLSIHAVDAVHFLDKETTPFALKNLGVFSVAPDLNCVFGMFYDLITSVGIDVKKDYRFSSYYSARFSDMAPAGLIPRGIPHRSLLAEVMNLFHIEGIDSAFYASGMSEFWPVYVDAGIPTMRLQKPRASWSILEEDCSDVKKITERIINQIECELEEVKYLSKSTTSDKAGASVVGSAEWYKGQAAYVKLDGLVYTFMIGVQKMKVAQGYSEDWVQPIIPAEYNSNGTGVSYTSTENKICYPYPSSSGALIYGTLLMDSETVREDFRLSSYALTQIVPWSLPYNTQPANAWRWTTPTAAWNGLVSAGIIDSGETIATLDIFGRGPVTNAYTETFSAARQGVAEKLSPNIKGMIYAGTYASGTSPSSRTERIFPDRCVRTLFDRSNITGSMTWKGDPRMQPRDVVTFERLDGTSEEITLQDITLTHEGGGTTADITYRKGIV